MTEMSAQRRGIPAARRVNRLVGCHRQAGYPHPEERLGSWFALAATEQDPASRLNIGDNRVRGFPYRDSDLRGRHQVVLAHG
jgi:hypothetical protein